MNNSSLKVPVAPTVLRWAREEMEIKIEAVAEKTGIEIAELLAWESEEHPISLATLKALHKLYNKPLAVFLLSAPPGRARKPTDNRTFQNGSTEKTKDLVLAIRRAQRMQEIYRETLTDEEDTIAPKLPHFTRNTKPETLAASARADLSLSLETQFGWADEREALSSLIRLIESKGVLVFQMTFSPKDARGFVLPDKNPPVIVLSSSDSVRARIFTLLHEYCHLLLGEEGISDWNDRNPTEQYCNQFASAFLMPNGALENHIALQEFRNGTETDIGVVVSALVKDFKVSTEAMLTALLNMRVITKTFYDEERARIAKEIEEYKKNKKKKSGGPTPVVKCVAQRGVPYVSAVISASREGKIVLSDVSDYLGVRQKHIHGVETLVRKKNATYAGEII